MTFALAAALVGFCALGLRSRRHRPLSFRRYFSDFQATVATHRGFGKMASVPENTVAAFAASERLGFRAHELDVRLTSDKKVVLLHGPTLEHTTNAHGRVEEHTYHEIAQANAAHYLNNTPRDSSTKHKAKPTTERVPLLSEVLARIHQHSLVNVEIKRDRWDFAPKLETFTYQVAQESGALTRVCFSGFHFLTLWNLRKAKVRCPVGLLIEPGLFARAKCWVYRHLLLPDNIHLHHSTAKSNYIQRLKKRGYGVAVWTVNDANRASELFLHGADFVITDNMNFIHIFGGRNNAQNL
jgi:glycerophosphoryl diester phosphodiesterase